MLDKKLTSNSLDNKTGKARLAYSEAETSLASFIMEVTTGKLKKLPVFFKTLDEVIENLQNYIKVSGSVRSEHPIRKPAKYTISTLKTIRADVEDRTMNLVRVKSLLRGKISDYLQDMQEHNEELKAKSGDRDSKDLAIQDFINIRDALRKYAKFERKLPRKLKRPDSFQISEVPVMARLGGRVGSVSFLKRLNIPYTPIGFEGGTSDIGIVFEKQNLLMFSKESALQDATFLYYEDLFGMELDEDEFNDDPKAYISKVSREYYAKFSQNKRDIKKKIRDLYSKVAQSLDYTTKGEIAEFVKQQMALKTSGERSAFDMKALIQKTFKQKALVRTVESVVNPILDEIETLYESIDKVSDTAKAAKGLNKNREKSQLKPRSILLRYANAAVDEISKQSGHEYVIISPDPIQNPRNADIVLFWIVPKVLFKVLDSFSNEGINVINWGLPWAKKSKKISNDIPKSLELSIKMPRGI